ncbi:MAG: 2-hydroxychromene-2-carboxylate isomerase [Alphaproteobacteria bacterium]
MPKTVDYYFVNTSPYCYLGAAAFEALVRKHGLSVNIKPFNLISIFPKTGGVPLAKRAPARQAYRLAELARWSKYRGLKMNFQPAHFPVDPGLADRMVIAADLAGAGAGADAMALAHAGFAATWAEERDISDEATLIGIADRLGMDGTALLEVAKSPAAEARYEANTGEALERGIFGAPTYFFGEEMFWGQDRLDFLERAVA